MARTSNKAQMIVDYVNQFVQENGYAPSVREIGKECGIKSTATVHSYLEKLQTKGYLNKATNKKRSVTIGKSSGISIPLIGTVTAGQPIFAYEKYEDYYTFPVGEFKGEDLFMLRVQGTSMIDAGIMNGVDADNFSPNGELTRAMISTVMYRAEEYMEDYMDFNVSINAENGVTVTVSDPETVTVGGKEYIRTRSVYEYNGAQVGEIYTYIRKLDDDLLLEFDIGGTLSMPIEDYEKLFG